VTDSSWPAPAKLNLFLHVVGRRADGYHNLQTVFQFLDRADRLEFLPRADGRIRRHSDISGVAQDEDLAVRAARLLQQVCGIRSGVDIRVEKRLPIGGGLGSGSSDAATTLVALNALWNAKLSEDELAELGLRLGADVPVFVHGHAAWAEGVGERLVPVQLPEPWYLVLCPDCAVATGKVFQATDLTRNTAPMTIADFLAGAGRNDCESVVRRLFPQVAEALDWLARHAEARLTGTGACVFARFESEAAACAVLAQLPAAWKGFVARGLNVSPLLARLQQESAIDQARCPQDSHGA
jgi:4-diphosphocytidyl-2-C-methyl-D-erythritol kinase